MARLKNLEELNAHGPVVVCGVKRATELLYSATRGPCFVAACSISSPVGTKEAGRPNFSMTRVKHIMRLTFEDDMYDTYHGAPTLKDVEAILSFGRSHEPHFMGDRRTAGKKVLFHCQMGHSRSTAAAFICFAQTLGRGREEEALELTKQATVSSGFYPNSLMVRYADRLLDRAGNMMRAIWPYMNPLAGDPYWQIAFEHNWEARLKEIQDGT